MISQVRRRAASPNPALPRSAGARAAPADLARIDLALPGTDGAVYYFGTLSAVLTALDGYGPVNTDRQFAERNPGLCASTVLVSGVPGDAAVYAQGLGTGWTAAEAVLPPGPADAARTVHPQIVVPPAGVRPGWTRRVGARVIADRLDTTSSSVALSLVSVGGGAQTWSVGATSVTCTAPPAQ